MWVKGCLLNQVLRAVTVLVKFESIDVALFFTSGVNPLRIDRLSNKNKDKASLIITWLVELFVSITKDMGRDL